MGDGGGRPKGPLGIDPLHFSAALFVLLILFVLYLLLPRGVRVHHFRAYPKRYAWSARSRARRGGSSVGNGRYGQGSAGQGVLPTDSPSTINQSAASASYRQVPAQGIGAPPTPGSSAAAGVPAIPPRRSRGPYDPPNEESVAYGGQQQPHSRGPLIDLQQNDEVLISATMQQLRDPGVLIVAHGSRGKPKTVRLQLVESAITWRTETRKKSSSSSSSKEPKIGKLHQVPLSHIMYVDVGKQTTALRRVENAAVSDALCFSLLTKEGSLDLEASSPRERDALVSCFSLVLDEVHAQNWRDIYRGPSSEMPSSFDDFDQQQGAEGAPGTLVGNSPGQESPGAAARPDA